MRHPHRGGYGYGRPTPSYRKELTEVGVGPPMGELLRRYWHPIDLVTDANDTPRKVRQPWYPVQELYGLIWAHLTRSPCCRAMNVWRRWKTGDISVRTISRSKLPDGKVLHRISEAGLPTLRVIPSPRMGH